MKRLLTAAWLVWAVTPFLAHPAVAQTSRPAGEAEKGTLSGRVIGPDGRAVAGARVLVEDDSGNTKGPPPIAEAVSGADGRFRLGPAEATCRPRYTEVRVTADGLADQYVPAESWSVFPGVDCDLGVIRMERGRAFTGQVVDVDGSPRSGQAVDVQSMRWQFGNTPNKIGPARHLTTDSQGRFRTPPLPVGFVYFRVAAPGRQRTALHRPVVPAAAGQPAEYALQPIRLQDEVPLSGVVRDEQGEPIARAHVFGGQGDDGHDETDTDSAGRFVLHGFGPHPEVQLQVFSPGHVWVDWRVIGAPEGYRWDTVRRWVYEYKLDDSKLNGPAKELTVVMKRLGWIEGKAIDAATGEPVRVDQIVVCNFERKADGEVVLAGCSNSDFDQPMPGSFRCPYLAADEYHLTVSAAGYENAEAFTPKVDRLQTIDGVVVRMTRLKEGARPQATKQHIAGVVTRDGQKVQRGWAELWKLRPQKNRINPPMARGRLVDREPFVYARCPIRDGAYELDVPYQDEEWYVVAEESNRPPTQVGPVNVRSGETKPLDIACTEGGGVRGTVRGAPAAWADSLWVAAFTRTGLRAETRVNPDGTYHFARLAPGEYGLKVGHDALADSDVTHFDEGPNAERDAMDKLAEPWKRATVVKIEPGREVEGVGLEFVAN